MAAERLSLSRELELVFELELPVLAVLELSELPVMALPFALELSLAVAPHLLLAKSISFIKHCFLIQKLSEVKC